MGPSRGMSHPTSTKDRIPPLVWGGSLTSPAFLPRPKREGRFRTANHSEMSHIDECGCGEPERKPMSHPPLDPVTNICGVCDMKISQFCGSFSRPHPGPQTVQLSKW